MMHLIIGRTCSGKSTLERLLEERGLKPVVSRTTRPMRTPGEKGHVFIEPEELDLYPDRLTETVIDGNHYFTTPEDLKGKDVYVIDPVGMYKLCDAMPDEIFTVVHMRCEDEVRKARYLERIGAEPDEDDRKAAEAEFERRDADEDGQFSEFERMRESDDPDANVMPKNVKCVCTVENAEDETSLLSQVANDLAARANLIEKMLPFTRKAGEVEILDMDADGRIAMYVMGKDEPERVSVEEMSQCLVDDPEGFVAVMRSLLSKGLISVEG
ncbi:MAG: hypothetical protein Q4B30_00475 [Coriobacteriaceae bacterium]|nr:hypothetical protein [Coriobacteriaceae bacterium]